MTFIVFPTVRYRRRCWLSVPATSESNLHAIQPLHATKPWLIPPKVVLRGKPSGRSCASMATLPAPFTAYSKGPGLTELLRLYALRSPASPFVSAFIVKGDRK
jgi:hypothetical protein